MPDADRNEDQTRILRDSTSDNTRIIPEGSDDARIRQTDLEGIPRDFGRYQILRQLGAGGMGTVYLAEDTEQDRQVALKTPSLAGPDEQQIAKRFLREARSAATIHHANVCPIFDIGEFEGRQYLTMAYVEGCELARWIERTDDVPVPTALRIIQKIALGLAAAHDAGIVHRDLKPGNVMMNKEDEPIIMDFGMVRLMDVDQTILTPTGTMVGTPAYMAPEQIMAERDSIGPETDIYSLGVIMYELLSGWPPFSGSLTTMLGTIVSDPPPELCSHDPNLDPQLDQLCLKALAKSPQDRYRSGRDLAQAIDDYLAGHPFEGVGSGDQPGLAGGSENAGNESSGNSGGFFKRMWRSVRGSRT